MILNEGSQHLLLNGTGGLGLYQVMPERPDLSPTRVGRIWVSQDDLTPVPAAPYFISVSAADGFIDAQLGCIEAVDGYQLSWSESTVPDYEHVITDSSGMFHFGCTVTVYLFGRTVRSGRYSGWSTYGQIGQGQDEFSVVMYDDLTPDGTPGTDYPGYYECSGNNLQYDASSMVRLNYWGKGIGFFNSVANTLTEYGGYQEFTCETPSANGTIGAVFGATIGAFSSYSSEKFVACVIKRLGAGDFHAQIIGMTGDTETTTLKDVDISTKVASGSTYTLRFEQQNDTYRVMVDGALLAEADGSGHITADATRIYTGLYLDGSGWGVKQGHDWTVAARLVAGVPTGVDPGKPWDELLSGRSEGDTPFIDDEVEFAWLPGNTSTTKKFKVQTGTGTASAAPAWDTVADADVVFTDVTTGNCTTSKHGYAQKAVAPPGRNDTNVFGIACGESIPSWKTLVGTTDPSTIGVGDSADPGASAEMARVDHIHGSPATWTPAAHQMDSATYHTVSGLTTGHFAKALSATTFGFAAHGLTYSDVASLPSAAALVWNEAGSNIDARFEGDTDANLIFLDASADKIGIGTNAPAHKLDVVGNVQAQKYYAHVDNAFCPFQASVYSDTASYCANYSAYRAHGTEASKTTAVSGDAIMVNSGFAWDGSAWTESSRVLFSIGGTVGSGAVPGSILYYTADSGGTLRQRCQFGAASVIMNPNSVDSDFKVLTDNSYEALFVDASNDSIAVMNHASGKLGFFTATPVAKQNHIADPSGGATVDAEARSTINSILSTLETYGLLKTS